LNERKINIDDDYIKFIRFGQHFIDKNGNGILAYISNNSFIDGVTHRQMRKHLLESFEKIYVLNLHGNSRKQEVCPDGSPDKNVFDIMQGVSINLFVKTGNRKNNELGKVFYYELQGKREFKYDTLNKNSLKSVNWKQLEHVAPYRFFVPKDFNLQETYDKGLKITELFKKYSAGIKTKIDHIATDFKREILAKRINDILSNKLDFNDIRQKYNLSDKTTWEYNPESNLVFDDKKICKYEYRPFDYRFTYYEDKFLSRTRSDVMNNLFNRNNVGLENSRNGDSIFIGKLISDEHFISDNSFKFPLYLYPSADELTVDGKAAERVPNLDMEIVAKFAEKIGIEYVGHSCPTSDFLDGQECPSYFTPENLLDYIYAVLHSPSYREKYKEFLKIDFPRIPLPDDANQFWKFVSKGCELRKLHLMESPELDKPITSYPVPGDNVVEKVAWSAGVVRSAGVSPGEEETPPKMGAPLTEHLGKVFINPTQYFDNVPDLCWNFYIGGYQPAQKWLKDRKGRKLSYDDIVHYQKIIVALKRTAEVMEKIGKVKEF